MRGFFTRFCAPRACALRIAVVMAQNHSVQRLANVPVVSYAEPRDPNAIYTFLGLASLPRLRPGNPLRLLPREMVLKIARFVHGYRAGWEGVNGRSGELAAVVDVSWTFFPDCGGARAYENPTTGEVQYYPRCVVSCASLKAPPSMLAEAEHPMTAAEHLARGPDRPLSLDDDVEGQARDFLQTHELD